MLNRSLVRLVVMVAFTAPAPILFAQSAPTAAPAVDAMPIAFERETLPNGLRVIYAPMTNAPVVHVRVLYHVGSKDEAADRQGFAHMFEHMMFRGSEHVPSELHMKLISGVGGISNAFTSFDQTTYVNTVPNTALNMALWLEADRMASFKVSDNVFKTERNVVKEEWRLRYANQPFGYLYQDLFALAFKTHNYKWQAIGDMDQLAAAHVDELQDFHDRYYTPNNACLTIAGQFDVAQAKAWVHEYYAWIKPGPAIVRVAKPEPVQTDGPRELVVNKPVPYTRVMFAYKSPAYRDDDHLALELLTTILGGGRSSRLYQALVANDPIAANVSMGNYQLEDPSVILASLGVLPGKDPEVAIARARETIDKIAIDGVTSEELEKAKTQARVSIVQSQTTAESVATALAEEEVFGGDAARVNQYFDRLNKMTADDLKRVAGEYLTDKSLSIVEYRPGKPTTAPASGPTPAPSKTEAQVNAEHPLPTTAKAARRQVEFPAAYPTTAPSTDAAIKASFAKGVATTIRGVQVITMTDPRLPTATAQLCFRGGFDGSPAGKEGVASLTSSMLMRGAAGKSALEISNDLDAHGLSVGPAGVPRSNDGDVTVFVLTGLTNQFAYGMDRFREIVAQPDFPPAEFAKLQKQAMQGLLGMLSDPGDVADQTMEKSIYGSTNPLGASATPQSLQSITLDDVKAYYATTFKPENAILIFSGAIEPAQANALAEKLLDGLTPGTPPQADYAQTPPRQRRITLVDNPDGQQAVIRMGTLAYTLADESRFAGSVLGQVLSSGIDSRLNMVLRAQKGLTYGAYGYFRPSRHGGAFELSIETKPESVDDAITSTFEVLAKLKSADITDAELQQARTRVAGAMVLDTQTIDKQAGRRVDTILNGYPVDYYDHYAERIAQVTPGEVKAVANKYLADDAIDLIVVGPAAQLEPQLKKFGTVTIVPMPLAEPATTRPAK